MITPAIAAWVQQCQDMIDAEDAARGAHVPTRLFAEAGKVRVRIVAEYGPQRSAWAFVDPANGNVFKPASWSKPAPHARGNIATGTAGIGRFGPAYLR